MLIREVSEKTGITSDTLRYYEKIGLIKNISRDKMVLEITRWGYPVARICKCMRGVSIDVLKKYVNLMNKGNNTIPERKQLLESQLEILKNKKKEIETTISKLKYKIQNYEKIFNKWYIENYFQM